MLQRESHACEALDLNHAARDAAELLGGEMRSAEVSLRLDLAPDLPKVSANTVEIQQVLLNLMANAIQSCGRAKAAAAARRGDVGRGGASRPGRA